MSHVPVFCSALLLCAAAGAQNYTSAPPGYLTVEGPSSTTAFTPFYDAESKVQWMYNLRTTVMPAINKLEQRRDGVAAAGTYPARSATVEVKMCDTDIGNFSTTFASNYIGTPTVVYTSKTLNLPDHSAPNGSPAPWTVSIPFDANYLYLGTKDILVELSVINNSSGNTAYSIDCVTAPSTTPGQGTSSYINTAGKCTTPNGAFDIYKTTPQTTSAGLCTIGAYGPRGPSSSPGILAIGFSDPNIAGILCAPLRTSAEVGIPVTTDAVGAIGSSASPISVSFNIPVAGSLYTQFAVVDATQTNIPVALSDAVKNDCVLYTGSAPPAAFLYKYGVGSLTSPTGTRYTSYIPVIRFTY